MDIEPNMLKQLARGIYNTHEDEINCDECFESLDAYVDVLLAGQDAQVALPMVHEHLQRCKNCREEFEALYAAVQVLADLSS